MVNESLFSIPGLSQTAAAWWSRAGWPCLIASCSSSTSAVLRSLQRITWNCSLFVATRPQWCFSMEHTRVRGEQMEGKQGFRRLEHTPGALFAWECEVGVRLISSTHERLAPVCLAATSLSVCFISVCQAVSGLLLLLLLGLDSGTSATGQKS